MYTVVFFILVGWVVFWLMPFLGGGIRNRILGKDPAAGRAFDLTIIAAWILMLVLVAVLSPNGLLRF